MDYTGVNTWWLGHLQDDNDVVRVLSDIAQVKDSRAKQRVEADNK